MSDRGYTGNTPTEVPLDASQLSAALLASLVPSGTLLDFAGTSAPTGYLACDGSAVSRTVYATLFSAISTTWGAGDGSTTFNLPDFRRRTAVGSGGSGTATLGNAVGNTGGAETHTLVTAELAAHGHTFSGTTSGQSADHYHMQYANNGFSSATTANAATSLSNADRAYTDVITGGASNDHTHTYSGTTANNGSGTAHNNMQPSAVVLKIIKT